MDDKRHSIPVDTGSSGSLRAKLIAMYFPQLHAIPENDTWWGKGFTDWDNVKKAAPLFDGHYQPRIPLDYNYYDQSQLDTIYWQVDLARKYGLYGFCHYHYWFDGTQLLETPTNLMLENKDIDFPFCLSWANETWSRRWDGRDHHILIEQTHPPRKDRWELHFNYLIKAWTDDRAIKVDGKPVFIIYRPHKIPKIDQMLDFWREKAASRGLKGLYFMAQKQYEFPSRECLKGFDAIFQFQPFESIYFPGFNKNPGQLTHWIRIARKLPLPLQNIIHSLREKITIEPRFYDYDEIWSEVVKVRQEPGLKNVYPGAFVDWDNTARYNKRAIIFKGVTPERFKHWLSILVDSMTGRDLPENFIFLNAWNEWAECTYIEPDTQYGYQYLEIINEVLATKHESDKSSIYSLNNAI
jgi:hypothetical protein